MPTSKEFLTYLYHALASPIGIELPTSDVEKCRTNLYAARTAARDPALSVLEFRQTPAGNSVLIVKVRSNGSADNEA